MLKKAITLVGIILSLFLLWFALYNYREAGPIAEENLRGLALSITAAIENLAVHDPSLADLARYHPNNVAYFALIDRNGVYRFHSNPDLIGTPAANQAEMSEFPKLSPPEARVALGTGEQAFQFTSPIYLPHETFALRLTLHTYRADTVIRRAKLNTTILLGMLAIGWLLIAALIRYARREELFLKEMARRESLARLGEMGAMLAHEIRNPLAGIKGFAQVVAKRPTEPRNSGFAQNIVTEAIRLENLVTELLAYASGDAQTSTELDLAELIRHTVSLITLEANEHGVEILSELPAALQIHGNRDRLEQVILNLGKNALQAMPEGGVLRMNADISGSNAIISVKDSGHGIAEQDLPKIFEPFFTTKARGTGLGLALCRKFVEEHHGKIELLSAANQGTEVTVTLPLLKPGSGQRSRS